MHTKSKQQLLTLWRLILFLSSLGNPDYFTNDVIYLLRIDNDEKSHYIHIKHLQRLFNLNRIVSNKDKNYCPYCEKQCEENMGEHIKQCYNIQLRDRDLSLLLVVHYLR